MTGLDFLNAKTGWAFFIKVAQSHQFFRKPGATKNVRRPPTMINLLYYTRDGGRYWAAWRLPSSLMVNGMDLVTPQVGFLHAKGGWVKTTDGGRVWSLATL